VTLGPPYSMLLRHVGVRRAVRLLILRTVEVSGARHIWMSCISRKPNTKNTKMIFETLFLIFRSHSQASQRPYMSFSFVFGCLSSPVARMEILQRGAPGGVWHELRDGLGGALW